MMQTNQPKALVGFMASLLVVHISGGKGVQNNNDFVEDFDLPPAAVSTFLFSPLTICFSLANGVPPAGH
jgi:hypothetical protein